MNIVQAVKMLNSISRARLNFRRRPILCTTLYRNLLQASNFSGSFDQLFLWILLWNFHRRCLSTSSIPWCKKVKNGQKLQSRGGGACLNSSSLHESGPSLFLPTGNHLLHFCFEKSFLKILTFRHSASSEKWGRTGSGDTEKTRKEKNLARFQGVQKKKKKTARLKTEG